MDYYLSQLRLALESLRGAATPSAVSDAALKVNYASMDIYLQFARKLRPSLSEVQAARQLLFHAAEAIPISRDASLVRFHQHIRERAQELAAVEAIAR